MDVELAAANGELRLLLSVSHLPCVRHLPGVVQCEYSGTPLERGASGESSLVLCGCIFIY